MKEVLLDVGGFQSVVDFETGEPIETEPSESMRKVMEMTPKIPFPGDRKIETIDWTIDAAIEVNKLIQPDYMFISMATPMMLRLYEEFTDEENDAIDTRVFQQVDRFLSETGFEPIIVGGGGVSKPKGVIDFSSLTTQPILSMCSHNIASLYDAAPGDAEKLKDIEHIKQIISKEEYIALNRHLSDYHKSLVPDYIIVKENGWAYESITKRGVPLVGCADMDETLPVYSALELPDHIRDVSMIADRALDNGSRVAIILLEGIGEKNFKLPHRNVINKDDFFTYDQGHALYFALNTGWKYNDHDYPPVPVPLAVVNSSAKNPFSQFFKTLPTNTLGTRPDIVTAAVGSRSGFTHETCMADLCLECHARNLAASGVFALVNNCVF